MHKNLEHQISNVSMRDHVEEKKKDSCHRKFCREGTLQSTSKLLESENQRGFVVPQRGGTNIKRLTQIENPSVSPIMPESFGWKRKMKFPPCSLLPWTIGARLPPTSGIKTDGFIVKYLEMVVEMFATLHGILFCPVVTYRLFSCSIRPQHMVYAFSLSIDNTMLWINTTVELGYTFTNFLPVTCVSLGREDF